MPPQLTRRNGLALAASSALFASTSARAFTMRVQPLDAAYTFLSEMMDLYAQGDTLRVPQSFVSTQTENFGDNAFTYDIAVVILAYLQRGNSDDVARASVLGASLVYAQANDRIGDGRLRNAYHARRLVGSNGMANAADGATACGNMAWVGLALCKLYAATGNTSFLSAAVTAGNWIETELRDTRGAGGYLGGFTDGQVLELHKGSENNIDVVAFFAMLAQLDTSAPWAARSAYAQTFVESMWNAQDGFYWVGTLNDGVTTNKTFVPEDVQSWSFLATLNTQRDASMDWALANLSRKDHGFVGQCFSNTDHKGVWFEGTAHLAAALALRGAKGDAKHAATYLASIEKAQATGPNTDGQGIIASSRRLPTDGGAYYPALHTGATGWYCIARQTGNPFRLA